MSRITISQLRKLKQKGQKFACLTAYDASFAAILDKAGVELLLVGDSLGMVVQGHESTVPVTLEDILYHCQWVQRGSQHALLMADMPFASYATPIDALKNASRLMQQGGVQIVKLEGGAWLADTVQLLTQRGIPVCAHLGLLPQSVHQLGGYRVQGKTAASAEQLQADALALQAAGASLLLLECVVEPVAAAISTALDIPVIGIGASAACDAQILVVYDVLGITQGKIPSFSKNFLMETGSMDAAVAAYVQAVKTGAFPTERHVFS